MKYLEGKLDDQFPLVVWQTGSGTQSNMNVNEVIANRAHVLLGGTLGDAKKQIHPNDDVNKSQSSNDTFPTAMHIASYKMVVEHTPAICRAIEKYPAPKGKRPIWKWLKLDVPILWMLLHLPLGQEFSGYVSQLDHSMKALRNTLAHLSELALGGTAVGTGINTHPKDTPNWLPRKSPILAATLLY
jgi:fumarate hydratase, class II